MPSSAATASSGRSSSAAARFSRRCVTEEVPGIGRMLGARRSSQASATCIGVTPGARATLAKADGSQPGGIGAGPRADLGDDHQVVRIGMQGLANQLVGDMRAVVIAGVDMVYPGCDRLAQYGAGRRWVLGWAEDAGPRQPHGPIAEPPHGTVAESKSAGLQDIGHADLPNLMCVSCARRPITYALSACAKIGRYPVRS